MKKAMCRIPSASMVVAIVALVAAVSGVAIAEPGSGPGDGGGTHGIFKIQGTPGGRKATVLRDGPFIVTMTCTKDDSGTGLSVAASSSQPNSVIAGNLLPAAGSPSDLGDIGQTSGFAEAPGVNVDMEAPKGQSNVLVGAMGVNSLGADCWANLAGSGH